MKGQPPKARSSIKLLHVVLGAALRTWDRAPWSAEPRGVGTATMDASESCPDAVIDCATLANGVPMAEGTDDVPAPAAPTAAPSRRGGIGLSLIHI